MNPYILMLEEFGANLIVFKDNDIIYSSDKRGVSPLVEVIQKFGLDDLKGVGTADRIVGKAAILLNVYMGSSIAHALIMSETALKTAKKFGLDYSYQSLVENIVNREGTGMCPFEILVDDIEEPSIAFNAIMNKLEELKTN